jgi:hypothetical protein
MIIEGFRWPSSPLEIIHPTIIFSVSLTREKKATIDKGHTTRPVRSRNVTDYAQVGPLPIMRSLEQRRQPVLSVEGHSVGQMRYEEAARAFDLRFAREQMLGHDPGELRGEVYEEVAFGFVDVLEMTPSDVGCERRAFHVGTLIVEAELDGFLEERRIPELSSRAKVRTAEQQDGPKKEAANKWKSVLHQA